MLKYLAIFIIFLSLAGCTKEPMRQSTAAPNVTVLEQQFVIPGLNRGRTIRLYLPPDYDQTDRHYPVLYMHDGQNLFDDATSYVGEWHVDETLNKLYETEHLALIVVGVDHGGEYRWNELNPWDNEEHGAGEGTQYTDFIVKTLKPWIDAHYRTLTDFNNTAIMGSSMGGLISQYALCRYPGIFSKAGIYSPSFWISAQIYDQANACHLDHGYRLHYLSGDSESDTMVSNMQRMASLMQNQSPGVTLKVDVIPKGEHNEGMWSDHFESTIRFLFLNTD